MSDLMTKYPWLGWGVVALVEVIALLIGAVLWWHGLVAWYIVPFFLTIPPIATIVFGIFWLVSAQKAGENPFQ